MRRDSAAGNSVPWHSDGWRTDSDRGDQGQTHDEREHAGRGWRRGPSVRSAVEDGVRFRGTQQTKFPRPSGETAGHHLENAHEAAKWK